MDNVNMIIAYNLKQLRDEKKLSLDALAKITGVSKSMLGQIERGDVNPTISTVWKIANGLKISFTELMIRPEIDSEVFHKEDVQPLLEDNGKFKNYPMFPFDSKRRFEIFYIEIEVGSTYSSEAHPLGAQEFITVYQGELAIKIGDNDELILNEGCAARFRADKPHVYKNLSQKECKVNMVIYYPEV